MILNLTSDVLSQTASPGSLYYRHPEYNARWWWREFNRISYLGGREYARPCRLTMDFDYPLATARDANGMIVTRNSDGQPVDPSSQTMRYPSLLFRHSREKQWEYENRQRRAHYHNFVGTTVNMLVSHALKKGVTREGDEKLTEFWGGVDCHRQISMDVFMRDGLRMAQAEGMMWCFVDVPTAEERAKEPEIGDLPYLYWVNPLDILDWSVDEDGELVWLKQFVYYEAERDYKTGIQPRHLFRVWTKDEITEITVDPKAGTESDPVTKPNPFGRIPAEPLYAKKNNESYFPDGEPSISDLCKAANAVYNYRSLLDEILYKQTFSWLTIPDPNVDAVQIGTNTVFGYNPLNGAGKPEYVSPDPDQARVLMEAIAAELEQARQAFGVGRGRQESSLQKSSGDALELESEDKRSILADVANAAADFEQRLLGLLNTMRSVPANKETHVQYPTEFDVQSFKDDVAEALSLQSVGMSPEIMLAVRQQLASRKLSGMSPDKKQELLATLKVTDASPALDNANANRQGNSITPNRAANPGQDEPPSQTRATATGADEPGKR